MFQSMIKAGAQMCQFGALPGSQPETKPETRFGEITAGSIQEGVGALAGIMLPMGLGLTSDQRQEMRYETKTAEHRAEKKEDIDIRHDREGYDLISRLATQRNFAMLKMPEKPARVASDVNGTSTNNLPIV